MAKPTCSFDEKYIGREATEGEKKTGACYWNVVVEWGYAERNRDVLELSAVLRKHKRNWNVNEPESTVRMQN